MMKTFLFLFCVSLHFGGYAQLRTLSGQVKSSGDGTPLAEVSVSLPGGLVHATTDSNGSFKLQLSAKQLTLEFTHVGFIANKIVVSGQQSTLLVYLTPSENILKNVVVSTGYQKIPKERATGSFTIINNDLINRSVSTGILERLENVSSGLLFDKRYNSAPSLLIRGQSTILSDASPLIVVDNFPYEGDINNINPNDIENVTILKDAAAASIWGARAGNGVIVITTKRGKRGQPLKVELNNNITIGNKPNLFYNRNFLNSRDFIDVEKTLFNQGYYTWQEDDPGQTLSPVVQLLIAARDGKISAEDANNNINELSKLDVRNQLSSYLYQKSINQQYSVAMQGGQSKISYFLSAGLDQNRSNLVRDGFKRITLNSLTTYYPLKSLELSTNIVYSKSIQTENNTGASQVNSGGGKGLYPYAQIAGPDGKPLSIVRDYNSKYIAAADSSGFVEWHFRPLQDLRNADYTKDLENTRINTSAKYNFNKALNIEARYQFEQQTTTINNLQKTETYNVRNLINQYAYTDGSGIIQFPIPVGDILDHTVMSLNSHSLRGQLNFNRDWKNDHSINALAGIEIRQASINSNGNRFYGYDDNLATSVPVDYITEFNNNPYGGSTIPYYVTLAGQEDRNLSYYINAAYAYKKRYILSGSARKDESNIFGVNANQKGVPLWSAGLAWIASAEKFFPFASWLPYLKIRTTFGYSGNVNKSFTAYTTASYNTNSTTQLQQAIILSPPNPDLRWEKTGMANIGIDFETKNNFLSGTLEYYHKRGLDLIGTAPLDPTAGFIVANRSVFTGNNADMKGQGFDIQLVLTKNLANVLWKSDILFSHSTDKITRYDYESPVSNYLSFYPSPIVGKSRFGIYSFNWAGLDPETGDPQVYLNGKISKDYGAIRSKATFADLKYSGPALPTYFGAWRNAFSWHALSVGFNITYKFGYYFKRSSINYSALFAQWLGNVDYEKRWLKPGDEKVTQVPSMTSSPDYSRDYAYSNSSVLVEKGDHIRFQDINLSYQFEKATNHWLPFNNLKLYAYINNLGIIWRANKLNLDPDYVYQPYPLSKTYSLGINIQF
ncbi:MAG: SusC/RagA family TonB-linked outer membrane protein [Ginsengibacter sp.]